ncbi:TetR/AcrR family transcriptional regulator C-terminal domain-containing protein [Mycobacterium sp.]|uniref:TetR/AcrR family transcriptional regulator C-terminal domain-containing protein n=1 Tax=Mycobacterium sp. TaxID=1785 RepID=UPI003C9611A5
MGNEAVDAPGFDGDVVAPRTRGRPARISRERIIAAARTIAPEALTMQKVADVLGVDPKALNYHVGDRDGLRQLVVLDVFESELRRVKIPGGGDWRDVVRAYVQALREATIKLGVLAVAIHLPGSQGLGALDPVESVLQALVGAGFDIEKAGRTLTFITELAYAAGRDALRMAENPVHPDVPAISTALRSAAADDFPVLRQVVAAKAGAAPDESQFEFSLELVIAGLEQAVAARTAPR